MRALIHNFYHHGHRTGVGWYADQLVRNLRQQMAPDRIDVYPHPWITGLRRLWKRVSQVRGPEQSIAAGPTSHPWDPRTFVPGGAASQAVRRGGGFKQRFFGLLRPAGHALLRQYFRYVFRSGYYHVYHEPNHIPLPCDLPTIATVHDLSVMLHPDWHPADRVAHFERHFARGVQGCAHLLAISESARQEIIGLLGIAPQRVTRTYMGVRPGLRPLPAAEVQAALRRLGLPPSYLLCLGTIEPRKNVLTLLRAYCALPAAVRQRYPLLLVGSWGWNSADVRAFLDGEARHRGVRYLGYVADRDVPALYNGARALVFPTRYEGFGMPPVEMMACGGAVLASTAPTCVETLGGRAPLIDADDLEGWRSAMQGVCTDDDWWRQLRQGVEEVARSFTWELCAADTLRVYRAVAGLRAVEGSERRAA
jgi:alpha-1,3-rhamnosyl/mannosyltransferase